MEYDVTPVWTNCFEKELDLQLTLDHDFNVPDTKPDIEKLVKEKGNIELTEVKVLQDKVRLKGYLAFDVLYMSDLGEQLLYPLGGQIEFEELANVDGILEKDSVEVHWDMEDLRVRPINSRKLSVRSIVTLHLKTKRWCEYLAVTKLKESDDIYGLNRNCQMSQIHTQKKDTFRFKEEIDLPGNKPDIGEILWDQEALENIDIKLAENRIHIRGDIRLFVLYQGMNPKEAPQYLDQSIPFNGTIDCQDVGEEMIPDIEITPAYKNIEIREDKDGEPRILALEMTMALNILIYKEEMKTLLIDAYSTRQDVILNTQAVTFDTILVKNQTKCRVSGRIRIGENQGKILQICCVWGSIKMDVCQKTNQGILVEGVVYASLIYIAADDKVPICGMQDILPFSTEIEVKHMEKDGHCTVHPRIEQMSASMLDSQELEIKVMVSLDVLAFDSQPVNIITEVKTKPMDYKEMEQMPNMIGHVVLEGDTCWDLAKRYKTTIQNLMTANQLESEELMPGKHLLIIKNIEILN